jgi:hypothetical protein
MPRPSSLTLAKSEIFAHFTKAGPKIYAKAELNQLLINRASEWRLAKTTNLSDFIAFLQKSGGIKTYEFRAEAYDRTIVRYAWGTVSSVAIALTLNPRGYLSHGSAVHLHNLTKWKPKTVYLNVEQSPKPVPRGGLNPKCARQSLRSGTASIKLHLPTRFRFDHHNRGQEYRTTWSRNSANS